MGDYFTPEYSSFAKGLPSPADTPYETPNFIRSKRSSRATTAASSREQSASPPPLPTEVPDLGDKVRDGRLSAAVDPRRFTPTLHASLVSEILNLRRELDSKNHLVENLETSLSSIKSENDVLETKLSDSQREVRKAKNAVQQMEKGTYDAVEELVKDRDATRAANDDLRIKLEALQKKVRQQDEDAVRTQTIWDNEKEAEANERRQLERRLHVTESRLRTFVEEMTAQQGGVLAATTPAEDVAEDSAFKDSALGNESDTASIRSATPLPRHRRDESGVSSRARNLPGSSFPRNLDTPEPVRNGNSLADELGLDDDDAFDEDDFDETLEFADPTLRPVESRQSMRSEHTSRQLESRQSARSQGFPRSADSRQGFRAEPYTTPARNATTGRELDSPLRSPKKAADSFSLQSDTTQALQHALASPPAITPAQVAEPVKRVVYVDSGYQPSPPPSPQRQEPPPGEVHAAVYREHVPTISVSPGEALSSTKAIENSPQLPSSSPMSPPETPVVATSRWSDGSSIMAVQSTYTTSSTQTDALESFRPVSTRPKSDSLALPAFVPSIAIHPPNSRPSSPRPYALPPGTKNAACQAELPWPRRDASMQTEGIRVDKRVHKLAPHLQPALLPSPTFPDSWRVQRPSSGSVRDIAVVHTHQSSPEASPVLVSSLEQSPEEVRNIATRDVRNMPLKALPLPRPVLSPAATSDLPSNGPLNRASQYGVSQPRKRESQFFSSDVDEWSDNSDYEESSFSFDFKDSASSVSHTRSTARHANMDVPKTVPEHKEISPDRRPQTAGSYSAVPAPSATSKAGASQQRTSSKRAGKARDFRARSPSFGSAVSSNYSTQSVPAVPPYPIPPRASSKTISKPHSEGSRSPTPHHRTSGSQAAGQASLRKVQSANAMRSKPARRSSPTKARRRRRSPDLTPVVSMAFESPPVPTDFPIPELPPNAGEGLPSEPHAMSKRSADVAKPDTPASASGLSEETNLVDAIAATMVGEWMWKYIRKRKSFGIGEDSAEVPVPDQNGILNIQAHGTRHKRWVWLSPYERTIMWDTKQPTSGIALLGKKGRKLAIQSVLDVQDPTPLPKQPELSSAFGRSILILTPERALKFTAVDEERHMLWMTALTFLSQSSQAATRLPSVPSNLRVPPPPNEQLGLERSQPAFGRGSVRDSIRVAKGKRPEARAPDLSHGNGTEISLSELAALDDGADFPSVPRLYVGTNKHQRKRSNTLGSTTRLPPPVQSSSRNFSGAASPAPSIPTNAASVTSSIPGSSSLYTRPTVSSSNKSNSVVASPDRPNFFEAVGTIRMEAFVDPNVRDGVLYLPAPPSQISQAAAAPPVVGGGAGIFGPVPGSSQQPSRRRRGDSNLSQSTMDRRRAGYIFDDEGQDPFKGF